MSPPPPLAYLWGKPNQLISERYTLLFVFLHLSISLFYLRPCQQGLERYAYFPFFLNSFFYRPFKSIIPVKLSRSPCCVLLVLSWYTTSPSSDKVNRCLARYSPCATTTNQPTNRAPNEPAKNEQKCQFWAKFGRFRAKNPNF